MPLPIGFLLIEIVATASREGKRDGYMELIMAAANKPFGVIGEDWTMKKKKKDVGAGKNHQRIQVVIISSVT